MGAEKAEGAVWGRGPRAEYTRPDHDETRFRIQFRNIGMYAAVASGVAFGALVGGAIGGTATYLKKVREAAMPQRMRDCNIIREANPELCGALVDMHNEIGADCVPDRDVRAQLRGSGSAWSTDARAGARKCVNSGPERRSPDKHRHALHIARGSRSATSAGPSYASATCT